MVWFRKVMVEGLEAGDTMEYTWNSLKNDLKELSFEKVFRYQIPLSARDKEEKRLQRDEYGLWVLPSKGLVVEADSFNQWINTASLHFEIELPQPYNKLEDSTTFENFLKGFGDQRKGGRPCRAGGIEDKGFVVEYQLDSKPHEIISFVESTPYVLRSRWGSWREHIGLHFHDTRAWSLMEERNIPEQFHHSVNGVFKERIVSSLPEHVRVMLGEN